ncbi:hypothetical protein BH24ACT26_BH24ACT26_11540 [soil metagenome]|jgi:hypothetical protein
MAVAEQPRTDRLSPIIDEVARAVSRHALREGDTEKAKGALRIEIEDNVRRVIQVYWTPFEASVPGASVGLHLDVAEPRVHWTECYLSPDFRNWVFCFAERPDGEIQLMQYGDYATPTEAIEAFFNLSGWNVLTATDLTWKDVNYELGDGVVFPEHVTGTTGLPASPAVQESLKKSTILWMRWRLGAVERTMPVWYLYDAKVGKIYVLSGERQQTIPGAEDIRECDVILRWKGKNSSVAEIPANVRRLEPGAEWDQIAERIAEKRLNIPGLPEDTARRWRDECTILELTLRG